MNLKHNIKIRFQNHAVNINYNHISPKLPDSHLSLLQIDFKKTKHINFSKLIRNSQQTLEIVSNIGDL